MELMPHQWTSILISAFIAGQNTPSRSPFDADDRGLHSPPAVAHPDSGQSGLLVASVANFSAIQRGVFEQREKTAVERAHAMGVATTILWDEDQKAMRTLTDQVWTEWAKKSELTNKIIKATAPL